MFWQDQIKEVVEVVARVTMVSFWNPPVRLCGKVATFTEGHENTQVASAATAWPFNTNFGNDMSLQELSM